MSEQTENYRFTYQPSLDGLRAFAVLAVLVLHAFIPFTVAEGVKTLGVGGFLGVDLFFVLSGFLITSLLLQEWRDHERIDFRKFYARRALRLLPALALFVAAAVAHSIFFRAAAESAGAWRDVAAIALYLSNWIPINLYALRHTWSLAVEEQFYLIYPALLVALLLAARRFRLDRRIALAAVGALLAAAAVWRAVAFWQYGFSMRLYTGSDTRADALLLGCLAGMLVAWRMLPRAAWFARALKAGALAAAAALAYLFMMMKYDSAFLYYGGFTLIALLAATIIVALQLAPPAPLKWLLERSFLVWTGRLSYGVYLWHKLVYMILDTILPLVPIPSYTVRRIVFPLTVKIACSLVVAACSYYALEKPFLRLKARFAAEPAANRELPPAVRARQARTADAAHLEQASETAA